MIKKVVAIAVSVLIVLAVCLVSPTPSLADEPDIWIKTDVENEITPALTGDTLSFADDEASEFVHPIQWAKTPLNDEPTWRGQADGADGSTPDGAINATEALAWVYNNIGPVSDEDNYGVAEAWANPEQTLIQDSGDCEDLAFLLASLLKWHTDEVDTDNDLVYVNCGFVLPPDGEFHAWVFWYDASANDWHQLDPTNGEHDHFPYPPKVGTLWLNDEHVFGFLSGYYPGPWEPVGGYDRDDFVKIAEGGFGDDMNNYAWSMTEFQGDLYVGTGRNIPYMVGQTLKLAGVIPADFEFPYITHPRGDPMSPQWAEDMRAEIWRYHNGEWEMVHKAPPGEGVGYRTMTTFNGAIYAGVGGGFGDTLLIRSTDGETWEKVDTTGAGPADTRALTIHNGKLYIGTADNVFGPPGPVGEVFVNSNPGTESAPGDPWIRVTDFGAEAPGNSGIVSLVSFNNFLYACTQNINGFEVWKSKVADPGSQADWEQVVIGGAGEGRNIWGGTTGIFNDNLYTGTLSLPIPPELPNVKGFELIRINTEDQWRLVIGSYPGFVRVPNTETANRGIPESSWPEGFGNPLNFYCWSLQEHDGILYLGTFDASAFLRYLPLEDLADLFDLTEEQVEQIAYLLDYFGGADLWKTNDGINWEPVSLNGFDNPNNYGFRTMVSGSLYIGTANPFQGCEIWKAQTPTAESTDADGVSKDAYAATENVYATGSGFQPNTDIDLYIVGDLAWSDGDDIPDDVSSDGMNTLTTDDYGDIEPANVWPAPLTPWEYDMVFDANQNGTYDEGIDVVDHPDHPGFVVAPLVGVGGEAHPVNKMAILIPWIALGMAVIAGANLLVIRRRRAVRLLRR